MGVFFRIFISSADCSTDTIGLVSSGDKIILDKNLDGVKPEHRKFVLLANPFERIKDEILRLKELKPNWDGYGAIAVHEEIIQTALTFVTLLDATHLELISDSFANPNGTISIEWVNNDEEKMQLEIGLNNFSYFVRRKNVNPIVVNETNILSHIKTIKAHLDSIIKKETSI